MYGQSVLTNAHGERHEIAVAGHQAKPLDTPAEQQIHRVDRHFHVGRVLALGQVELLLRFDGVAMDHLHPPLERGLAPRSEEHTSELQSLMRISYAVFCLKKKN